MKKTTELIAKCLLVLAALQISACKKIIDLDYLLHHHDNQKACNVTRVISYDFKSHINDTAKFYYNSWGDPTKVLFNFPRTARPDLLFRYDSHHRLTDYIGAFGDPEENAPTGFEFWHRYVYVGDRITSDTLRLLGSFVGGNPQGDSHTATVLRYFTYDGQNRITTINEVFLGSSLTQQTAFVYNSDGNIAAVWTGSNGHYDREERYDHYDSKVNIHRTNAVWQFVDANYSVNNPFTASTYNGSNLPLHISTGIPGYFQFLYSLYLANSDVSYSCK